MGCQRPGRSFAFILKPEKTFIQVIPTDQNLNETEVTDKLVQVGPGFPSLCSHLLSGCSEPAFPCCMEPTHPNLASPVTCLDSSQLVPKSLSWGLFVRTSQSLQLKAEGVRRCGVFAFWWWVSSRAHCQVASSHSSQNLVTRRGCSELLLFETGQGYLF